ncbi:MAG: type II toxin-antitoxin system HicB family antitoxin [Rhodanobacteraceae bacterium]
MTVIRYAAALEPQREGGFTVTFPDIPEAVTEGDDRDGALFNAAEALTLALEQRLQDGEPLPAPTRTRARRGSRPPRRYRWPRWCGKPAKVKARPLPTCPAH